MLILFLNKTTIVSQKTILFHENITLRILFWYFTHSIKNLK